MESYRLQQVAYLAVPLMTGVEFFLTARAERKKTGKESALTVVMDTLGYVFLGIIPALFLFTIYCIETRRLPIVTDLLHRLDRYVVMFFFLGAWWQVFLITSLRARRTMMGEGNLFRSVWLPYVTCGFFISALILWVAPWNLMWVSVFWFIATFVIFALLGVAPGKLSKIFFILTVLVFIIENILFIVLDAIV